MAGFAGKVGLHNLIQRITSSFKNLLTAGRDGTDLPSIDAVAAGLHNENQRFDLWCRNLGAYQSGHASLEYRLRDAPKVYDHALRLLTDLDASLTLVLQEARGKRDAHPSDSGVIPEDEPNLEDVSEEDSENDEFLASYNAKPLADILLESIVAAIDRLYRLSFKIRYPATRFDLSRVMKFEDFDSETGTDILTHYAQFDKNHIKELLRDFRAPLSATSERPTHDAEMPAESTDHFEAGVGDEDPHSTSISQTRQDELDTDYLVQRLARANNIRRRQFRYWQTHQKKLAAVKAEAVHADNVRPPGSKADLGTWKPAPSFATTEATKAKDEDIDLGDNRSVVSSATYALMQKEPGNEEVRVPPFPEWLEDKKEFECPYCRILCPGSMGKKSAWETHVLRDLKPYVCTFEDCRQADQRDQLFDTFQSWRLHEIQAHTAGPSEPLRGEILESPGSQVQRRALEAKVDERLPTDTTGDTRTCPFCLKPRVTAVHVGAHLQRIAIFALPLIQHSGSLGSAEDEDSNVAQGSADASSITTTSYSGPDSDQSLGQSSSTMPHGKEGYIPEIVEMKCRDKTCDKVFTRKSDLAKHEKTHSRPFPAQEQLPREGQSDVESTLQVVISCMQTGQVETAGKVLKELLQVSKHVLHGKALLYDPSDVLFIDATVVLEAMAELLEEVLRIQGETAKEDHPDREELLQALNDAHQELQRKHAALRNVETTVSLHEAARFLRGALAKDQSDGLSFSLQRVLDGFRYDQEPWDGFEREIEAVLRSLPTR